MTPSRMVWNGKTVCVTGGTGFVGFQIVRQLVGAGARVRYLALRRADTHPIFALEPVEGHFGDVCDTQFVRKAFAGCDVSFHTHWVEWLIAGGAELRTTFRRREPHPSFQHVRLNRLNWFYDWSRARDEVDFHPRPLLESLRDTFDWYAARHSMQLRAINRFWIRPKGKQ